MRNKILVDFKTLTVPLFADSANSWVTKCDLHSCIHFFFICTSGLVSDIYHRWYSSTETCSLLCADSSHLTFDYLTHPPGLGTLNPVKASSFWPFWSRQLLWTTCILLLEGKSDWRQPWIIQQNVQQVCIHPSSWGEKNNQERYKWNVTRVGVQKKR